MSIVGRTRFNHSLSAVVIIVAVGTLYFCTAARDIVVGDSPELITAAVTLGVPHPPGYPLFTMLGHLFSLLPPGPIPFRVNLLSAVCDTVAIALVFLTAFRLSRNQMAAAAAAVLLATNSTFWLWSLEAEVFPLNNLLVSLVVYLLVLWHDQPDRRKLLIAAAFVFGLALSNHQTSILLVPAICSLLWKRRTVWSRSPKLILICVAAIALGFLPYLYVPWAASHNAFFNWGKISSWSDLIDLITRRHYGTGALVGSAESGAGSFWQRIYALGRSFGPAMGLLMVLGLVDAHRKQRWYFWFALLGIGATGVFFLWLANIDLEKDPFGLFVLERFFLVSEVIAAPLVALGIVGIAEWVSQKRSNLKLSISRVLAATMLILAFVRVAANYRKIDQSRNHVAGLYAKDILTTASPNAILLITSDVNVLPLGYAHAVERLRPDLCLVIIPLLTEDWYLQELRQRCPGFSVPFDRYDPPGRNLKELVEANRGQRLIVVGPVPNDDHSLSSDYWLYRRGLVDVIVPNDVMIPINQSSSENEQLLGEYHVPDWRTIKTKSFESIILQAYAAPALVFGGGYERIDKSIAKKWYRRGLEIDPFMPQFHEALARLGD